ncbi:P-II family nitrogen regulator [Clostridium tyrobutyricum]|uniref:P-II family nitrogen regulator n=1 Tax=Clostridium tyrobutyricum TaxID=1519 RepID=UPI001C38476A|nr:P-II family nitrogen regulator [Clostridium tyrobutyricum]MBV4416516.1 P-II family nitrogen regulator [Clostridium tyrobutyricum]
MKMIKAIVRPEKANEVLNALCDEGYTSATRISILGRGKQQGLKVGDVYYDEIPKEMIMMVVEDDCVEKIKKIIIQSARTDKQGAFGDGKIFVLPVEKTATISSGKEE